MARRILPLKGSGKDAEQERVGALRARLAKAVPRPHCELDFADPWQLLVATILSAQSTDRRVNMVTPDVFRRWPTPAHLARAKPEVVEEVIKSTGFFRNKTRSIQGAAKRVVEVFGGEVPRTMEEILTLPGVARKTANVVLGTGYGVAAGIAVDTHATRVSQRLGLSRHTDPVKIEVDLCATFPKRGWIENGHRIILHGRYVCTARVPRCDQCPLNELCPSHEVEPTGTWNERARWEARFVASRGQEG